MVPTPPAAHVSHSQCDRHYYLLDVYASLKRVVLCFILRQFLLPSLLTSQLGMKAPGTRIVTALLNHHI